MASRSKFTLSRELLAPVVANGWLLQPPSLASHAFMSGLFHRGCALRGLLSLLCQNQAGRRERRELCLRQQIVSSFLRGTNLRSGLILGSLPRVQHERRATGRDVNG